MFVCKVKLKLVEFFSLADDFHYCNNEGNNENLKFNYLEHDAQCKTLNGSKNRLYLFYFYLSSFHFFFINVFHDK